MQQKNERHKKAESRLSKNWLPSPPPPPSPWQPLRYTCTIFCHHHVYDLISHLTVSCSKHRMRPLKAIKNESRLSHSAFCIFYFVLYLLHYIQCYRDALQTLQLFIVQLLTILPQSQLLCHTSCHHHHQCNHHGTLPLHKL